MRVGIRVGPWEIVGTKTLGCLGAAARPVFLIGTATGVLGGSGAYNIIDDRMEIVSVCNTGMITAATTMIDCPATDTATIQGLRRDAFPFTNVCSNIVLLFLREALTRMSSDRSLE
ncbi:MAG: hypothetical protein M3Y07_07220 [Acidobacteriota bacterium]|nr:hypothetical protein [Acidobacteriota bacterium]